MAAVFGSSRWRECFWVVLAGCLAVGSVSIGAEYAPNVGPDGSIDHLVHRLNARYRIGLPEGFFAQPMNAAEVKRFLVLTDSLDSSGVLLAQEQDEILRLRRIVTGRSSLFSWNGRGTTDTEGHVHLEFHWRAAPSYYLRDARDSLFAGGSLGAGLSGALRRLSYYSSVEVGTDYRSEPFPASTFEPYDGVPYTLYGRADTANFRATDMVRGGLQYVSDQVTLELALDRLRQGPVVYSPLVLSGNAPPIVFLRTRWDLRALEYTHLAGLLRSQKDRVKYIYLHRIDVPLRRFFLNVGISEVVITGSTTDQVVDSARPVYYPSMNREPELIYVLPFVPFTMAEHYLGDRDNSAISFDLSLSWPRAWRWYAELLLDDMTAPWTLLSDDWGNKWAFAAGVQYFGAIAGLALTGTLEYARVEPWVYTHFYGGSHNFTHFGRCMGAPLGPNSDALRLEFGLAVAPRHTIGLLFANERTNRNARGGSITDVFQDTLYGHVPRYPDSWTKEFLGAGTQRSTRLGVAYRLSPFGWFRLDAEAGVDLATYGTRLYGMVHGRWVW